jgi:DNA recombination protein RmuC
MEVIVTAAVAGLILGFLGARFFPGRIASDLAAARATLEAERKNVAEKAAELAAALAQIAAIRDEKVHAEREAALHAQRVRDTDQKLKDWEADKLQLTAKIAAISLENAQKVSSKLLEDHKREVEAAKKDSEERVKKASEEFLKRLDDVTKVVSVLNSQVSENRQTMDTVWQALSSPGGAGAFAEVGLENALKSFGLVRGRDFFIQQQIEGKRLRPDAVVLLPGDTVLVIDSKASKFLLEYADADGTERSEEALRNLVRTMTAHLNGLASKNYKDEILASYRQAGRAGEIKRIMSIMCVPTEGAFDKIVSGDPEFVKKAAKLEIVVAGPGALACLIGFARVEIDLGIRSENQEKIIDLTRDLIDRIAIALEKADGVGKGLKAAAKNYADFAGSVNSRLLPGMKALIAKGVTPARNKAIRPALPTYELVELNREQVIDGESEEVAEMERLPFPAKTPTAAE